MHRFQRHFAKTLEISQRLVHHISKVINSSIIIKLSFADFERHDDDELGFRKNDIITIISQKDEHCWVGELNGLRGKNPTTEIEKSS